MDINSTKKKITVFIKKKVEESQTEGAVIGLSGGIDSAVTAYLSVEALGSRRVLGLIMPDLRVTPEEDVSDARLVASELCIEAKVIDIAPIHKAFMKKLEENRLAEGNLRARIRMSLLYYHSNMTNRLVVGTGDRSEFLLGYFTKYGDGGVDILPIADLYKTEVRRVGEALGINRRIIAKRSSPRLWPGQFAESDIGLSYEVVDEILRLRFDKGQGTATIASKLRLGQSKLETLLARCEASDHKRKLPEICMVH